MIIFQLLCILQGELKSSKWVDRRPFLIIPKSHTLVESIRLNPVTTVFKKYPEFRKFSGDDRLDNVITQIINFVNSPLNTNKRYKFVIIDIKTRERTNVICNMYKDFIPVLIDNKRSKKVCKNYTKLLSQFDDLYTTLVTNVLFLLGKLLKQRKD